MRKAVLYALTNRLWISLGVQPTAFRRVVVGRSSAAFYYAEILAHFPIYFYSSQCQSVIPGISWFGYASRNNATRVDFFT